MKIYLVGGAVRDKLLGLPVKDKDWVVVGARVEDMLAQGYQQVGREFPVFLHPQSDLLHIKAAMELGTSCKCTLQRWIPPVVLCVVEGKNTLVFMALPRATEPLGAN